MKQFSKNPTSKKKTWYKPEIVDLDVKNTNSGTNLITSESVYSTDQPSS